MPAKRHRFQTFRFGSVMLLILVSPEIAAARLGLTREQCDQAYGNGRSTSARTGATSARVYLPRSGPRLEIGFHGDLARYVIYRAQGRPFTPAQIQQLLTSNRTEAKGRRGRWQTDQRQAAFFPPVGRRSVKKRFLRLGVSGYHRSIVHRWYRDPLGKVVPGSYSRQLSVRPQYRGRNINYLAVQASARVILKTDRGSRYATFDLSYDSQASNVAVTNQVLIADARCYWCFALDALHKLQSSPASPFRWNSLLTPDVSYDEAAAGVFNRRLLADRNRGCLYASTVAAIDNPHVPYASIREAIRKVDPDSLATALVRGQKHLPVASRKRRIHVIGDLMPESSSVIMALIHMLPNDQVKQVAATALRKIATRYRTPATELGTDVRTWKKWWQSAKREK